jgi:flagellar P-ring protein precursor FlgI
MTRLRRIAVALALSAAALPAPSVARAEKLRDLAEVAGARDNQLLGYGIVTGLNGTGDDEQSPMALQSVLSMLRRLGVQVTAQDIWLRNVAAVVVTTNLGPFAKTGTKVDVTVSSIGNARSISGGVLVQTLLKGADQKTYAVAQGSVLTGSPKGSTLFAPGSPLAGTTNAGRIPDGAIVEREVVTAIVNEGTIKLSLRSPSFTLASRVVAVIDKQLGAATAKAEDGGTITVKVPSAFVGKPVELLAVLEDLEVSTIHKARVIVSERTQTIVAGGDVRLAPSVVIHNGLTITVRGPPPRVPAPAPPVPGAPQAGQPAGPRPPGAVPAPAVPPVEVREADKAVHYVPPAATLADVASALAALGLAPRELTSVLDALRSAGALEAEIVVQ